jgi:F0F1-type ATP synthase assembly protein I
MTDDPTRTPAPAPRPTRPAPRGAANERAMWFRMTEASSVGIEIVVAITVCSLGGYYIERYLTHWSPWTTLIGIALGCMTAARAVVRAAQSYQASLRASSDAKASANAPAIGTAAPKDRTDGRPS